MAAVHLCARTHTHIYIILYFIYVIIIYIYYESQPGSWLVAICERSENRGSGGVVAKRVKNRKIGGNFRQTPDGFAG